MGDVAAAVESPATSTPLLTALLVGAAATVALLLFQRVFVGGGGGGGGGGEAKAEGTPSAAGGVDGKAEEADAAAAALEDGTRLGLSPSEFRLFPLQAREVLSRNVVRLRFGLGRRASLNLPPGKHLQLLAAGKRKPYTPVTARNQQGYFELVVKSYAGGHTSVALHGLRVGDQAAFRGPVGLYEFKPPEDRRVADVGMVAGGSGITPMLQIMREVLEVRAGADATRLSLVYANSTVADVLCRDELIDLCSRFPEQLRVHMLVSRVYGDADGEDREEDGGAAEAAWLAAEGTPASYTTGIGRINRDIFEAHLAPAGVPLVDDGGGETSSSAASRRLRFTSIVLTCGPGGFGAAALEACTQLGYAKEAVRKL